jgi:class 3 adenylate cyclase/CHASE2 domain-containing sensor protein
MSVDIVMVDIDDRSLERVGRWPWPRSRLADCITELQLAGARTIALDLDLSDPQGRAWDASVEAIIDGDKALAAAADNRIVLSVLPTDDELNVRWLDAGGDPIVLRSVLAKLQHNPGADVQADFGLDTPNANAATATMHMLRRAAVERAIASGDDPQDLLKQAGRQSAVLRPLVEAAARRAAVRHRLPGLVAEPTRREASPSDRMPVPSLLERAGACGYVTILYRDPDGAIRRIHATVPMTPNESALPLGLAAVVHHLDIDPKAVSIEDDLLTLGSVQIPLQDGLITINWPRSPVSPDWPDMHRPSEAVPQFHGHLSMGEIVELAAARRIAKTNVDTLHALTLELLGVIRDTPDLEVDDWRSGDIRAEIEDEIDFTLGDTNTPEGFASLLVDTDDSTAALLRLMYDWRRLADAVAFTKAKIQENEVSLHNAVNDRLVFLGWTATGALADFVPTAVGPRTPGVLVHAALADMVLQNRTLQEPAAFVTAGLTAVLGLIAGLLTAWASTWLATILVVVLIGCWLGIDFAALSSGLLLPAAVPMVAIGTSWAAGTGTRAIREARERAQITRQFRARVPGALVDELARHPEAVSMTGQCREVSILFADLAGFTTASEQMGPEATVALLNRCMRDLTEQLTEHRAYVNKFLGDGLLAFWSAFGSQEDQADLACKAALACGRAIDAINADRPNETPLRARVGIATGEAIVGDCGAPPKLNDYTVIGDTANLSARLESANKQFGTRVLVDARTIECLLDPSSIAHVPLGPVGVVGRVAPVALHELLPTPPSDVVSAAWDRLVQAMTNGDLEALNAALTDLGQQGVPTARLAPWHLHLETADQRETHTVLRLTEK